MQRICFILQVKPERIQEYRERHRSVWPDMKKALEETGWNNYSLFLRPDGLLVGYLETDSFEKARAGVRQRHRARGSLQQPRAKTLLKCRDQPRYGRWRQPQLARRRGKALQV